MAINPKLLNEGERVVVSTRTHVKVLVGHFLLLLVIVFLTAYLGSLVNSKVSNDTTATTLGIIVGVVAAAAIVWWVVKPFIAWFTTSYTFTNRRFIERSGWIAHQGRTIPLNRISGVDYEIGVVDRIFGCGTLVVSDASEQGRVPLKDIPRVEQVQKLVADELHRLTQDGGRRSDDGSEDADSDDTPVWTTAEVAARTGVSPTAVRRLWLALGFPDVGDSVGYSASDLRAIRLLVDAVVDTEVDLATGIRLARAIGQNVARMSDWQVAALAARAEQIEAGAIAGGGAADFAGVHVERAETSRRIADEVVSALDGLLSHAWRRHLAASLTRLDADPVADDSTAATVTVGFADLVAFSALSNEIDANRLGEIVEIFEARSADVVAAHDGRMIKTLGDSVLFVADDPEKAVRIAGSLIDVIGADNRLPDLRIGLASGPVVTRMGDVFGPPVNLSARLTALARRNRVLADEATADGLDPEEYETRRLTARPLRGFGLVEPVAVRHR